MDERYMLEAIKEAKKAELMDEVPIGCVIVKDDTIIARAHNLREHCQQAAAHAEMLAIQKACEATGSWRLEGCTVYVTLEPCPMCSGAMIQSRIEKVVYGAKDPKGGCIESCMHMYECKGFNHYPQFVGSICEEECGELLREFFRRKRNKKLSESK